MDRSRYRFYIQCVKDLAKAYPKWFDSPASLVDDFLREPASYGYARALRSLLYGCHVSLEEYRNLFPSSSFNPRDIATYCFHKGLSGDFRLKAICFVASVYLESLGLTKLSEAEIDDIDENEFLDFDMTVKTVGIVDPIEKELRRYAIRLLDVTRSSQLVNFRPLRSSAMYMKTPSSVGALSALFAGKSLSLSSWQKLGAEAIYRCKTCGRYRFAPYDQKARRQVGSYECPDCDASSTHGRKSMQLLKENLTIVPDAGLTCPACQQTFDYRSWRKGNLACPNCGNLYPLNEYPLIEEEAFRKLPANEFVGLKGDYESRETCKTLSGKAKTLHHNFGLHVLYVAYGFLDWKDKSGICYHSPLLLMPVSLVNEKTKNTFSLTIDESTGGFEVNKTLLNMLKSYSSTTSFELPPFSARDIGSYLSELCYYFRSLPPEVSWITKEWEIKEEFGLGLFHYQKLQLEHDIDTHMKEYLDHPIIRRLCKDDGVDIPASPARKTDLNRYLLMDADSSQEEVVKASLEGKSFVLQGPPGSGKSQTITNIIGSNIAAGKTVLFVTEKFTARAIILDNLARLCANNKNTNLAKFVLDFESLSKNKRAIGRDPFVKMLNDCIVPRGPSFGDDNIVLEDAKIHKDKVAAFMEEAQKEVDGVSFLGLLSEGSQYVDGVSLDNYGFVPIERSAFLSLTNDIEAYFACVEDGSLTPDYRKDPLFLCSFKGVNGPDFEEKASEYIELATKMTPYLATVKNYGFKPFKDVASLKTFLNGIPLLLALPEPSPSFLSGVTEANLQEAEKHLEKREKAYRLLHSDESHSLREMFASPSVVTRVKEFQKRLAEHDFFLKRFLSSYFDLVEEIKKTLARPPKRLSYKECQTVVEKLSSYGELLEKEKAYNQSKEYATDMLTLGMELREEEDFYSAHELVSRYRAAYDAKCFEALKRSAEATFISSLSTPLGKHVKNDFIGVLRGLSALIPQEEALFADLSPSFETLANASYPLLEQSLKAVMAERNRLSGFAQANELLKKRFAGDAKIILDECLDRRALTKEAVMKALNKAYYLHRLQDFASKNGLNQIASFSVREHRKMLRSFAEADVRVLEGSPTRLYDLLSTRLEQEAVSRKGKSRVGLGKIESHVGFASRDTILANFDFIKVIKPCFMMSPLNVSQYLDISLSFDLVIFDEASQIFVEDALPSIVRGKQVIIAGDSKQLPPCDFFKAGDITRDDEESYLEEEMKIGPSLLDVASSYLSDSFISLSWHYRSQDESLISFANDYMEYGLITFPSSYHNPNHGIRYHFVPYHEDTCYDEGKSGSHTNIGEAEKIVNILYSEMCHPERKDFSLGVVAFSNAQALKIEEMWEDYKSDPSRRPIIEAYEVRHANEPIVFCNLDTMQGDERDTMLVSTCYGKGKDGRFLLSYLGRIRLESGKKRINVAITRARKQMVVVTSLEEDALNRLIASSLSMEENISGAKMLSAFLSYARSGGQKRLNAPLGFKSTTRFTEALCRLLDQNDIPYVCDVGDSDCKVNIAIPCSFDHSSYCLGIIIDDPRRPDFDSPREYARLTEQILRDRYGWKIYRVFPYGFFLDYESASRILLEKIEKERR